MIFVETKTDEYDEIRLPNNYTFHAKNRKRFKKKSGGIIIVYKKELSHLLNFVSSDSEFVQWIEFIDEKLNLDTNILLGCIYIPPELSPYSSDESFSEIEDELIKFSNQSKNIALVSDFNARTSVEKDFVVPDTSLLEYLQVEDDCLDESFFTYHFLERKNIPLNRFSSDQGRVNNYGNYLLDLCKRCGIFICNGRIFSDRYIGRPTCKGSSVVDYLLSSPSMFDFITDFNVDDFDPLFSDVHSRILFTLSFSMSGKKLNEDKPEFINNTCTYIKWDPKKADNFVQELSMGSADMQRIEWSLCNIDQNTVTSEQVNSLVGDIGNLLIGTAEKVLGQGKPHAPKLNTSGNYKPWFNKECREKRGKFQRARNLYHRVKSDANKAYMNEFAKEYRRALNCNFQKYREKCSNEIRALSKNDTKGFWKTIKKYCINRKDNCSIDTDTFFEYFKSQNSVEDDDSVDLDINELCDNPVCNEIMNGVITEQEVIDALKNLKNNKAPGTDKIINEFLKNTNSSMISIYCKLFNVIFDTGIIPESLTSGIIIPVYKNKGSHSDPNNFRPITLISCLGKLFTSLINTRLNFFANEISLISENQAGFRKGYSTVDNIFILHTLVELYFSFGKKLFCTFIDFKRAFDTVSRSCLWKKLQLSSIKGKCFKVIFNMYQDIKSCVKYNGCQSDFFPCVTGVRQGENLSPFLFVIFLNDLEAYFRNLEGIPLESIKEKFNNELHIYFELFVILYADDTVILSETKEGMQHSLNIFQSYCDTWKLNVNVNKTKVMIFSKRKVKEKFIFKLQGEVVDIVDSFSYLGVVFKYNGTYLDAKKKLVDQAQKALHFIYRCIRNENIPIDLQLKLFDSMIEPILLYGCEVWGYENLKTLEQTHLKFCKRILKIRRTTPNFIVYGELGRFPLEIRVKQRMISYWCKLVNGSKLSSSLYRLMYKLKCGSQYNFKWISFIESILNNTGMGYIFASQTGLCEKNYLNQILSDQFITYWFSEISNSSRGQFYGLFKKEFGLENYLTRLNENNRNWITKLRASNLRIPIETGRWQNVPKKDRICTLCRKAIGDEFHLLFTCTDDYITSQRNKYLPIYYTKNPSNVKMEGLLSICNVEVYKRLSLFIKQINSLF